MSWTWFAAGILALVLLLGGMYSLRVAIDWLYDRKRPLVERIEEGEL